METRGNPNSKPQGMVLQLTLLQNHFRNKAGDGFSKQSGGFGCGFFTQQGRTKLAVFQQKKECNLCFCKTEAEKITARNTEQDVNVCRPPYNSSPLKIPTGLATPTPLFCDNTLPSMRNTMISNIVKEPNHRSS